MNSLTSRHAFGAIAVLVSSFTAASLPAAAPADETIAVFTDRYCSSCHNDVDREGGLDLTSLQFTPSDPANFATWVKVHDRVQAGEMPPKEKKRPAASDLSAFVKGLGGSLVASEQAVVAREGRATRRRLNSSEYETTLRDLLHAPWIQVKDQLPEDGQAFKFNKVGEALDVSYVHMTRYMGAADYALRQVLSAKFAQAPATSKRYYARDESSGLNQYSHSFGNRYPDRHKFPVLGLTGQTDVRLGEAPLTVGDSNPAIRDQEAVGWVSSNYVTGFGSSWTSFRAPATGRYRLKFSGYTLWAGPGGKRHLYKNGNDPTGVDGPAEWFEPDYDNITEGRRNEPITVYAKGGVANRWIGGFNLTPTPAVSDIGEVWLLANEYIVTDSSRLYRSRPTGQAGFQGGFTNALAQSDGQPGVAFRWMEIEGPLQSDDTASGYDLLFGNLPLAKLDAGKPGVLIDVALPATGGRGRGRGGRGAGAQGAGFGSGTVIPPGSALVEVTTTDPAADSERLLRAFMKRAYRRPFDEKEVQRVLGLIKGRMDAGLGFAGSMLAGYTAVLASPEFVFIDEKPGKLDDYALATRLALFLWNSEPDAALRSRAERGELHRPEVLRTETERMLGDPKSQRFVEAFLDYWLEIRRMDETTPSTMLYNDYYLDDSLTEAALAETRMFFTELLDKNLPARNVVDSDFTFLNERLAVHYDIPGVEGVGMRRVALPRRSMRGGFMTQASVLKVTANGTTTSPVIRGKWVTERIVGYDLPPPPASVPAVEPDIRGAVTIRQQLDKHRADESCAQCHRKIDPTGFALESFDVMGGQRDRYRASAVSVPAVPGFGKNGWPFQFYYALPVDSSGQLADGRTFNDVRDFKQLLLKDEAQIARNLIRQLSIYATGSPVRFSDRDDIEQLLQKTRGQQYGVRSIVSELVQSRLFLNK